MDLQRNAFKHALAAGKLQIGLWSSLANNIATEIVADSGFDWILLDTEHSPNEIPDLLSQLQSITRGTATPIVRPAWNDAVLTKRVLDIGAQSVLFPYVQNAEEAKRARTTGLSSAWRTSIHCSMTSSSRKARSASVTKKG